MIRVRDARTMMATALFAAACLSAELESDESQRDFGIVNVHSSPHAKLRSIDLGDVRWADGFWTDRFEQARRVTLPRLWELAADPHKGHALENLRIGAGLAKGEARGTFWQDAWIYKWIESACYVYSQTRDETLVRQMDEVIDVIARAQQPDGYLATQTTLRRLERFQFNHHHELYTMGHLVTAACVHHRITGKTNLLNVARRTADYIHATYDGGDPMLANCPINPSIIMGAVELYRTTGERRYLDLANIIIDNRGRKRGPIGRTAWGRPLGGTDLNQDAVPLRNETEVVGHAVFFTYLFAGATDVYLETGDESLWKAVDRLWRDLTEKKMYVTGGISPVHKGLSSRSYEPGSRTIRNDEVHEAAGHPYDLPNATAYNETCGQIGNLMWNWRMLLATGEARFADVMERSLYNSILSGVEVDGDGWSYTNPLRWYGQEHELLSNDAHQRFDPGEKHICCPTNLLRTEAAWHGYLYSSDDSGGLWVHHYAGSTLNTQLTDGRRLQVVQSTEYPWQGDVRLVLKDVGPGDPFAIHIRIPHWVKGATLRVNGERVSARAEAGTYASLARKWQTGDTVELHLPMHVRVLVSHPRLEQTRNHVAVMRGPVVYCLESTDLPANVSIQEVHLPRDSKWNTRHEPDLLGGVTVLETTGYVVPASPPSNKLYDELLDATAKPVSLRLIPYYVWNNRGEPEMTVWLPLY